MYVFENLDQALIGMSKELIEKGVKRETRGYSCFELPDPVLIKITNPTDRYITIPQRKWNKFLPFAESLWLASGSNTLSDLPGRYVKSLYNFSDDGKTWRAGYGSRMRQFTGISFDYETFSFKKENRPISGYNTFTDQFDFILKTLQKDKNSRQAVITISDPSKDCFDNFGNLKVTKDMPCTKSIHFQVNSKDELDCIVDLRSNDVLWGFSAINVFNFTLMQEYFANILELPIGNYYHKADNFHYYENFHETVYEISTLNKDDYKTGEKWTYKSKLESLSNFDKLCLNLYEVEKIIYSRGDYMPNLSNDMFNDWVLVFYKYKNRDKNIKFRNPYLNKLFN